MRARIIGLVAAASLAAPTLVGQVPTASAMTAQFWVTGYVLTGLTATGTYTHPGTCAVDPRVIPLGSYFYISGIGGCHAEDTGGAVIGYHVDVWVGSVSEAYAITGWHTVTWGEGQSQVLGYRSSNPQPPTATSTPPPVPTTPPATPAPVETAPPATPAPVETTPPATPAPNPPTAFTQPSTSHGYAHGNAYSHLAATPHSRQPVYALISLHGQACHPVHWTTYANGQAQTRAATACN